jgi:hypothetical protein
MGFGYEKLATPCVRTNHNSQSESIPIPIPIPTPMGTRSRRIANYWLQAAAKPNDAALRLGLMRKPHSEAIRAKPCAGA